MKAIINSIVITLLVTSFAFAGDPGSGNKGIQKFSFKDEIGRNQATFFSTTPLEDITGMTSDVWGNVSLDFSDPANTLNGEISISTASLKSGIDLRDEHIRSSDWLDAENYPTISFKIKKVNSVKKIENNKLEAIITGEFTARGITKEVESAATIVYLAENEMTKMRMPGDLLGVRASFNIKLSDYGIEHIALGKKVSEDIEVNVNIVGSNNI